MTFSDHTLQASQSGALKEGEGLPTSDFTIFLLTNKYSMTPPPHTDPHVSHQRLFPSESMRVCVVCLVQSITVRSACVNPGLTLTKKDDPSDKEENTK